MEKIQFWRLFTTSPLWDSAQGPFKSWVIPPSSGHGIILFWWAVGMQMMLLSKHMQGPATPVTLVALHPLSWLPLDASVPQSEFCFDSWLRYWSLKLLSFPDCNCEQMPLSRAGGTGIRSSRLFPAVSPVFCVPLSTTENMDNFEPLQEHFNHLSSITLLNRGRTIQENW